MRMLKQMKYRRSIFLELRSTEEAYLLDLKLVVEHVIQPIAAKNILNQNEQRACFSNLESIYQLH
jgi:hypothetical protein